MAPKSRKFSLKKGTARTVLHFVLKWDFVCNPEGNIYFFSEIPRKDTEKENLSHISRQNFFIWMEKKDASKKGKLSLSSVKHFFCLRNTHCGRPNLVLRIRNKLKQKSISQSLEEKKVGETETPPFFVLVTWNLSLNPIFSGEKYGKLRIQVFNNYHLVDCPWEKNRLGPQRTPQSRWLFPIACVIVQLQDFISAQEMDNTWIHQQKCKTRKERRKNAEFFFSHF